MRPEKAFQFPHSISMARRVLALLLVALALLVAGCAHAVPAAAPQFVYDPAKPANPPERPQLALKDDDRILVLAPHPDDEVLATGGLVQQALAQGLPVKVVFLTNGDNNEFAFLYFSKAFTLDSSSAVYAGQTRALEALRAGRELGLETSDESFLGYPDFGTLEMWQNRWGDNHEAFRSMFSEQNEVPYWFARTPGASYKGESILKDLTEVVADFKPTKVFVSHPGDTNPDHVAYDLYLRTALWDLEDKVQPEVYNFLTHYGEWPLPRGLLFDAPLEPPAQFDEAGRWVTLPLTPEQVKTKLEALKRHKTQYSASRAYLESYMRANELFDRMDEIVLTRQAPGAVILPSGAAAIGDAQVPQSPSVGISRKVRVEGDDFVFTLDSGQQGGTKIDLQVFGYRPDRPFAEMPKIAINVKGTGYKVSDRKQALPLDSIRVTNTAGSSEVRIPLALLGNPEKVHFNAAVQPSGGPLDPMPWVAVALPH
jgi:LmbE family N-acetylglucosaminyl deacetylase